MLVSTRRMTGGTRVSEHLKTSCVFNPDDPPPRGILSVRLRSAPPCPSQFSARQRRCRLYFIFLPGRRGRRHGRYRVARGMPWHCECLCLGARTAREPSSQPAGAGSGSQLAELTSKLPPTPPADERAADLSLTSVPGGDNADVFDEVRRAPQDADACFCFSCMYIHICTRMRLLLAGRCACMSTHACTAFSCMYMHICPRDRQPPLTTAICSCSHGHTRRCLWCITRTPRIPWRSHCRHPQRTPLRMEPLFRA